MSATEALFSSALALPSQEREVYLAKACSDHDERARIEQLLLAEAASAEFVKESLTLSSVAIDDYRLLHEISEGGCGVVYLAEQLAPIKREVALKIIKLGMDTKAVINRFEAERQALAMMDHPNIAKVFDAGATSTGRPYFVMELVRGIKITEYSEHCRLTLDERLELFIQVCQAIQHAHLKGIIHRDIKPSNVLVTLHDGEPAVKVIDFGVAKAMQGRLTDHTLHTFVDQLIGTPAYMSPEQTEPGALGVDTRSDVYSLGVLLYELITGVTPFDNDELMNSGLETMRRRVREDAPTRPSKRIDTRFGRTDATARAAPLKQIKRDLDWIVMRCLEKDREHRYQAAAELTSDIRRFLRKEPIQAHGPSSLYLVRKFAERHRKTFAAAVLAGSVLLVTTAASTWQAVRATRAERLAQETMDALISIFEVADPFANQGAQFSADEVLKNAKQTAYRELSAYPAMQARLMESIGRVHRRRGNLSESLALLRESVRLRKSKPAADGSVLVPTLIELALAERAQGDMQAADRALSDAETLILEHGLQRSMLSARILRLRGSMAIAAGRSEEAARQLGSSLQLIRSLVGDEDLQTAETLLALASHYQWTDEFRTAERVSREALAIYERKSPATHPDRIGAEVTLAEALGYQGRYSEAARLLSAAYTKTLAAYGGESSKVADLLESLAVVKRNQGLIDEAEQHGRDAVRISEAVLGRSHVSTAYVHVSLGGTLLAARRYAEARSELTVALEVLATSAPPDHPYVATAEYLLGEALLGMNRLVEAADVLARTIERCERTHALPWRLARVRGAYGEVLFRSGRVRQAEALIIESYRMLASAAGPDAQSIARARERVTTFYESQGRDDELDELLASIAANRELSVQLEASTLPSATVPSKSASPAAH